MIGYCTACDVAGAYELMHPYYACTPECEDIVGEYMESVLQGI